MTAEQYADMQPGDVGLVRATLLPRGKRGDAGDHVEVKVGNATLFVPVAEIVRVMRTDPQ